MQTGSDRLAGFLHRHTAEQVPTMSRDLSLCTASSLDLPRSLQPVGVTAWLSVAHRAARVHPRER